MLGLVSSLPDQPTAVEILTRHLPFQLIGIGVVLFALCLLYGLCSALGNYFRKAIPAADMAPVPAPSPPPVEETPDVVMAAIIAAAVATVIDQPHRVLSIKQAPAPGFLNAWAIEGRFQHFSSHKVR